MFAGGDWILQKRMHNADWLQALLPKNAPLSTMRVITTSTHSLLALNCLKESEEKDEREDKSDDQNKEYSLNKEYSPDFSLDEVFIL